MEAMRKMTHQFDSAMTLNQKGVPHVPEKYILPTSQRADPDIMLHPSTNMPIIDLSYLHNPALKSHMIEEIRTACKQIGVFQVINHRISTSVMKDALDCATEFFDLPPEEKMCLVSDNVEEPVRYGTSLNHRKDDILFWRDFIKHYSNPLSRWIHLWPLNPPSYREKMGNYANEVHRLQKQLIELVMESLGLAPNYLKDDIDEGSQLTAVNCYPTCPEPELTLGLPPHSDYGSITILFQNHTGLQVLDRTNNWALIPLVEGGLIVLLGDQMEVISNGLYKGVIHRATVSSEHKRLSIANLHSLAMKTKARPAAQLIDENHPESYQEFSFQDFLDFIARNDITKGRFIDTLKKNP